MGSNGYIMHITYLNYVDISPAEPKKSIFRVCKTVKITKIPKITIFFQKYLFQKNGFKILVWLVRGPETGATYPVGHTGPYARLIFQKYGCPGRRYGPAGQCIGPKIMKKS